MYYVNQSHSNQELKTGPSPAAFILILLLTNGFYYSLFSAVFTQLFRLLTEFSNHRAGLIFIWLKRNEDDK